ncbi:GNAT family N-acetyltransferase, partial [Streptomyces sp. NPDC058964]|uniref:GNAT family N-acetyltransferase n=1 Tax=Streptomyces sp. NPDC058964 TaxID=3346681 RepID=UPI0036963A41
MIRFPAVAGDVPHVLDNPALAALTGPHAHFAERRGRVLRYPVDVSPWLALPAEPDADDWADLAALAGPGAEVSLPGFRGRVPDDWEIIYRIEGVQLVDDGLAATPDVEAVRLGPADVPEMLDLVERTQPGPFLPRTIELGDYLGIRRDGALIAMAGERLRPPGWTEISAVCTDPAFRGEGLATRLILAVAHRIRERGDTPFLH